MGTFTFSIEIGWRPAWTRKARISRSALNPTWTVSGEIARSMRDRNCEPAVPREVLVTLRLRPVTPHGGCFVGR